MSFTGDKNRSTFAADFQNGGPLNFFINREVLV